MTCREAWAISAQTRLHGQKVRPSPTGLHLLLRKAAVRLAFFCLIVWLSPAESTGGDGSAAGFNFDDGTTQGWTLKDPVIFPAEIPLSSNFSNGWSDISNYPETPQAARAGDHRGSLQIYTPGGHGIKGPSSSSTFWVINLSSPDLSTSPLWQQAKGYTVRIANCMSSAEIPLYVNLHLYFRDPDSGRTRHFVNGNAVALPYGTWSLQVFDDWGAPAGSVIEEISVSLWGSMARGEQLRGGVYVDEVLPLMPPATWYVDNEGDGPKADGSAAHPFHTIQEAVNKASNGDFILVQDGVYTGAGNWGVDLAGKAITVQSLNGAAHCTIQGEAGPGQALSGFHFHAGETGKTVLQGFTIAGSAGAPAIACVSSSPTILNCVLRNNQAATGGGLYCEHSSAALRNCVFLDNASDRGGALFSTQSTLTLVNCTFRGNRAVLDGGALHLTQSQVDVSNCILWRNVAPVGSQVSARGASTVRVSYSALGDGAAGDRFCEAQSTLDRTTGNITVDPLLQDDGYHLRPDSPCIDGGEPTGKYWESTDIDGAPRLFNVRVDMGADEFSPKIANLTQGTYADAIQEAIDHATNGDTIVVPDGIHTGAGNYNVDFRGKAVTVRSANGPAKCVIDCHGRREESLDHWAFKFVRSEGPDSVLDGLTLTNGNSVLGGAVFLSWSSPTIRNCRFVYNWANDEGGSIACGSGSSPLISNCLFLNNGALGGGALSIQGGGSAKIINCTFLHNIAREGSVGGAVRCSKGHTEITNCLFWNNVTYGGLGNQIALQNLSNSPTRVTIAHCNVMGGREDIYVDSECRLDWGPGNMDVDPQLTPDGHLRAGSPCLDAGTPLGAPAVDWEAEPRSSAAGVDIGCDEYVDSDADLLPDYWEQQFFGSPTGAPAAEDSDGDGFSNLEECTIFGSNPAASPYFVDGADGNDEYDGLAARRTARSHGPKKTIQAGINAAGDGDTVLVAAGTYSGTGNVSLETWGKSIVVHAPAGPASTIIDGGGTAPGFLFWSFETPATVVSGFTVTRGKAKTNMGGGAMACWMAHPRIRNCILANSEAGWGGGLYSAISTPILEDCRLEGNRPDGVQMAYGAVHVQGVNRLRANGWVGGAAMLAGSGLLELQSDVGLRFLGNYRIRCDISGPGTLKVDLTSNLAIEGEAKVNLAGAEANGKILCDGLLRVRDQAQIRNAQIAVRCARFEGDVDISNSVITAEIGAPYGQFFVEDTVTISNNEIHADGDRYMDLDPSVFAGIIANNRIYVTITEGRHTTRGGLLELRGKDRFCATGSSCEPGVFRLPSVPGFDTATWTMERLELLPGAKVSLTNRFDFGNGGPNEVIYVRELVLGDRSILNTAYNRLYYERLEDHGGSVVNLPLLGFSLNVIRFDDENEFASRVVHNNFLHYQTAAYNRIHVARVLQAPDPRGLMRLRVLTNRDPASPNFGQVVPARAKGLFAKSGEDQILITFDYLFETNDPDTEIVVYLSDVPELRSPRDPNHDVEIGRLRPPRKGRPGAVGSNRFGTFHRYISRGRLDFVRGTRVELELIGPDGAGVLINDWDPQIQCPRDICLNFIPNALVEPLDLLPVIAASGGAAVLSEDGSGNECIDGALSCDGFADTRDTLSFEWALRSYSTGSGNNVCPPQGGEDRSLPLVGGRVTGASRLGASPLLAAGSASPSLSSPNGQAAVLIMGKPAWKSTTSAASVINIVSERLYGLDGSGRWVLTNALAHGWCNAKLARDGDGNIYQVTLDGGVLWLHDDGTSTPVITPGRTRYDKAEPRYGRGAEIYIGIQNDGAQSYGRPIWDVAFGGSGIYVVPVVVVPDSGTPYLAAARLTIPAEKGSGYRVEELYDDPSAWDPKVPDNPHLGGLREIEADDQGNVYVVNAHRRNESDILWKYAADGGIRRVYLSDLGGGVRLLDPVGLCVARGTATVYVASGQIDKSNPQAATVYEFSTETLALQRQIRIEDMQQVTDITEDPQTGALWVVGFNLEESKLAVDSWNDVQESFYRPRLARISPDGAVESVPMAGDHDLALPLSVLCKPNPGSPTQLGQMLHR